MTAPTQDDGDVRRDESIGEGALHRRLSRRDFIKFTTAATAGGYAALAGLAAAAEAGRGPGGGCGGGGCGGSSSGTPLDPPPGAALLDPQPPRSIAYDSGVVSTDIAAYAASVNVGGVAATLLTYDGKYPGPLIDCRDCKTLKFTFTNQLPAGPANLLGHLAGETSLHTHGWHVSPNDPMDNVMRMFMPSDPSWTFEYDLSMQEPGTMCWYHPHVHQLTAEQVWGGMHGVLLMDDPDSDFKRALADQGIQQRVLVLKDISIVSGRPAPHSSMMDFMHGKEGDLVMVNGQLNPVLTLRPGEVQRWRILNASNARFYKLQLQGHSLQVIGTDGGLLDKPYPQSSVLMSPGERLDVMVKAGATGTYKLLALPYARMGMMTSSQRTMMTIVVKGTASGQQVPRLVNPDAGRPAVDLGMVTKRSFTLSMGQGRGYINGLDFDVKPGPCTVDSAMSMDGPVYELWEIKNASNMDHPWHQHVNPAQVQSIVGGDSAYRALYTQTPAWKDVVIVPKGGSVTQLVRISDYMGMAMFHCHILEHEDIGMMGVWNIGMTEPMPM